MLIYIRYEESLEENAAFCKALEEKLSGQDNIRLAHYIRQLKEFGNWGDSSRYPLLLDALSIDRSNIESFPVQSTATRVKLGVYGLWTNLKKARQA